ncbi:MAG: DUF3499 domain-containing protein, partial [Actinomycetales bacterium]
MARRRCSRPSCSRPAIATLTYVYADSTAVLGPLATYAEPHCYDLCDIHGERLTAPRGWEVVRITPDPDSLRPTSDDLEALADAVREAARPRFHQGEAAAPGPTVEVARRGHLRMLASTLAETEQNQASIGAAAAEPNWHLGEDEEIDELLDDDLGDEDVDVADGRAELNERDEFNDLDDYPADHADEPFDEPVDESDGRARVLNLPLRSL